MSFELVDSRLYHEFAVVLKKSDFSGVIKTDYEDRVVFSTDNSIYQILPEGIIYPKTTDDISLMMQLASKSIFKAIIFSPRGGGTGTNGQSLTCGFLVDTRRFMSRILEINLKEEWVRVECGVTKDAINDAVKDYGLFFPPELSTSDRATIGGMINTDASGSGSIIHGKTSDYVLETKLVLVEGTVLNSKPLNNEKLNQVLSQNNKIGNVYKNVKETYDQYKNKIAKFNFNIKRKVTGYNLKEIYDVDNNFNLNSVICGSEGTLAFVTEAKLSLKPLPKCSAVIVVCYSDFLSSLKDAQHLLQAQPDAIETIDENIVELALENKSTHKMIASLFTIDYKKIKAMHFIECVGDSEIKISEKINALSDRLTSTENQSATRIAFKIVTDLNTIKEIWRLRKLSVGLLGKFSGDSKPIPFVEDVAVPPEALADFVSKFKTILDKNQLKYGMFGHVDAGVLHVRPAINMKEADQRKLVRLISNEVFTLVRQFGGVFWGEHGKGLRSEYVPDFFGSLYPALQQIKHAFDPENRLNPGKIATPDNHKHKLLLIDQPNTRGGNDQQIDKFLYDYFSTALYCNGNAACLNWNKNSQMCPTYKATGDQKQSPKGRSNLIREWLKYQGRIETQFESNAYVYSFYSFFKKIYYVFFRKKNPKDRFTDHVYQALESCMACKSCVGQCPVQVNIPDVRAKFFDIYFQKNMRPISHIVASNLEIMVPKIAKCRKLYNGLIGYKFIRKCIESTVKLVDLPEITSSNPLKAFLSSGAEIATLESISTLSEQERSKSVIFVQDLFTSYFETNLVKDIIAFTIKLGFKPFVLPFYPNGKAQQVYGFNQRFFNTAAKLNKILRQFNNYEIPLVGIDAASSLIYRDEYATLFGEEVASVFLLSEWLSLQCESISRYFAPLSVSGRYDIFIHCSEATCYPKSVSQWISIFKASGLKLSYYKAGCCGMSGMFGHESKNRMVSRVSYNMSWRHKINSSTCKVATGYSCRSQIKRSSNLNVLHPIQILLKYMTY